MGELDEPFPVFVLLLVLPMFSPTVDWDRFTNASFSVVP